MTIKRTAAALLFALVLVIPALADEPTPCGKPCRMHPQLSGACFTVRGRMDFWNGTPSVRIWRVGTKRILGVSEGAFRLEGFCNLPPGILAKLDWETSLFADFTVCPFTDNKPGEMQFVCVESAKNASVRPRSR